MAVPIVSIITAVKNGEGVLPQSIDTIQRQSLMDWEWVVVDDGSTDSTWDVLRAASRGDPRIRPIRNPASQGLSRALNLAISESTATLVARMDAEDLSHPDRLEMQVAVFKANPEIGLVASDNQVIDEQGRVLEKWSYMHTPEEIYYTLHFHNCLCHSSVMFRRDVFDALGGYKEDLEVAQDYELWLRISKAFAMYKIPRPLVSWRKRSSGASVAKQKAQWESAREVAVESLIGLLGHEFPERFWYVVMGRQVQLDDGEQRRFFHWMDKLHAAMESRAPKGIDRERLARKCRETRQIISLALGWRMGPGRRLWAGLSALARPRILRGLWHHLRRERWSLV